MEGIDPEQKDPKDRREVNPPIPVESATWSVAGELDWWVKERQQWFGRVRVQTDARERVRKRALAQKRLPVEVRQQLIDAIYRGEPFRAVLRNLGLTSNQVWGLTKTDQDWSKMLEAALMATRRDESRHGTSAAYFSGCACSDCRECQRIRMARNRV
jgi:hypothetical protein